MAAISLCWALPVGSALFLNYGLSKFAPVNRLERSVGSMSRKKVIVCSDLMVAIGEDKLMKKRQSVQQ